MAELGIEMTDQDICAITTQDLGYSAREARLIIAVDGPRQSIHIGIDIPEGMEWSFVESLATATGRLAEQARELEQRRRDDADDKEV